MNISIFGLGYVGAVCTGCFAHRGHHVVGVDVDEVKIKAIKSGRSPILEEGLDDLIQSGIDAGRVTATLDVEQAVAQTDISLICVGTPSQMNGSLDLTYVKLVAEQIGAVLARKRGYHCVVVRSTVLPGTVRNAVLPLLEASSGKKAGVGFGLAMNPEFLREGSAIEDFNEPEMTVIGEFDTRSGDHVATLYAGLPGELIRRPLELAEMIKYACNVWHATKVAFGNEIGSIAKAFDVDGRDVMDIVCRDKKLNISKRYLRPGNAFGGSCLPKDVRALTHRAQTLDVAVPMISALMPSNEAHVQRAFNLVTASRPSAIAIVGLTFKAGTDDLRESPMVTLAEMLLGKGYDLRIFDRNLLPSAMANIRGRNRAYVEERLPHLDRLLHATLTDAVTGADVIVLGNGEARHADERLINSSGRVVDLEGVWSAGASEGVCW